jgi:hypothetical protein
MEAEGTVPEDAPERDTSVVGVGVGLLGGRDLFT